MTFHEVTLKLSCESVNTKPMYCIEVKKFLSNLFTECISWLQVRGEKPCTDHFTSLKKSTEHSNFSVSEITVVPLEKLPYGIAFL